jgi:glyoxalase family protein
MRLDGIHHITAITGNAQRCVDFYAGVLGLNLIQATAGDRPDAHDLCFGDHLGRPGAVLGFLERPGTKRGRPGAGMVHTIAWRVADANALEFWAERLAEAGIETERVPRGERLNGADGRRNDASKETERTLRFTDFDGLAHELVTDHSGDEPLPPSPSVIPREWSLRGLDGIRAYSRVPHESADLLAGRLGFAATGDSTYLVAGPRRRTTFAQAEAPDARGLSGAGTVHLVAWSCEEGDERAWRERVIGLGARVTSIVDGRGRRSFRFREPSGVLFEITTRAPAGHFGAGGPPAAGRVPEADPPPGRLNGSHVRAATTTV